MPLASDNVSRAKDTLLPLSHNPRAMLFDAIPKSIKVFFKERSKNHHHEIISATANHPAWILGAQPSKGMLQKIHMKYDNNSFGRAGIHVVSMLHDAEMVMEDSEFGDARHRTRIPWFDHGAIDVNKGTNTSAEAMLAKQEELLKEFIGEQGKPSVFYCHCMAGVSRSFVETVAFLYNYTQKVANLFDFDKWPKGTRDKIPQELQNNLQNNPTIAEIAKFVKIQRPIAKGLEKVDGDQAGLLGLMALELKAEEIAKLPSEQLKEKLNEQGDNSYLTRLVKDLSLILQAPLDSAFRDQEDRKKQEAKFQSIFAACEKAGKGQELLDQMEIEAGGLDHFTASQHARFAILLKKVGQTNSSNKHAKAALDNSGQLTVGDQVEFLKTFVDKPKESVDKIARRIVSGTKVDRYNGGKQMAELVVYAMYHHEKKTTDDSEQIKNKLEKNDDISAESIMSLVRKNVELMTVLPLEEHIEKMSAQEHMHFLESLQAKNEEEIPEIYKERYTSFIKSIYDPNTNNNASFLCQFISWIRSAFKSEGQRKLENDIYTQTSNLLTSRRYTDDKLLNTQQRFKSNQGGRVSQSQGKKQTSPDPKQDPDNNKPSRNAFGG